MQCSHLAAGWIVALVGSTAVSAQTPSPPPVRPAAVEAAEGAALPMKPFSRLFEQQLAEASAALRSKVRSNATRRFICNTPVLPADPTVDPRFEVPLPATATRYTMRIIPPSCR